MKTKSHRARHAAGLFDELVVDNFAGGGGASIGIERALGRAVDVAINHDREAVGLHQVNHPRTLHHCEDVWSVDPAEATSGRPVGLAWFSPDCKHFSRAKGGKPVEKKIRGLAWVVVRWAAKVRPRVIMLENVREFETWGPTTFAKGPDGAILRFGDGKPKRIPCPIRKGRTFKRWVATIRALGYRVEWRSLDAADFGAPTHRKRLFLVARRDGEPIRWPEPSHGPGRPRPHRTAAECIDWSLPCPSIFLGREEGRRVGVNRPLAEKTMRRIAMGLKRFVLDNPRPFIVNTGHGGDHFRGQSVADPLRVVASKHGFGLVSPFLTAQFGERDGQAPRAAAVDAPIGVVTPRDGGGHPLIAPSLVRLCQSGGNGEYVNAACAPLTTIVSKAEHCLAAASLIQFNQEKGSEVRGKPLDDPLNTVPTANRFGLAAANLIKMNFGDKQWMSVEEPLRTVLAGANHHGLVMSFLTKYFGRSTGQEASDPLGTICAKDRFGIVKVKGENYAIADIGLRMLRPRELYLAQGFPPDYRIDVGPEGRSLTKEAQVRMCGNSVSPPVAEALVRANFPAEATIPRIKRKGAVA